MNGAFIHEKAICESSSVGEGTRIWGFAHVMPRARIGRNCNIGEQVFIENKVRIGDGCTIKNGVAIWDGVTLEDNVFVGPNAVFTNDKRPRAFFKGGESFFLPTLIKKGCTIGANATIVCGVTLGEYSMIGAGSVVLSDIPKHSLALGNPARVVARIGYCGLNVGTDDVCSLCEKTIAECSVEEAIRCYERKKMASIRPH